MRAKKARYPNYYLKNAARNAQKRFFKRKKENAHEGKNKAMEDIARDEKSETDSTEHV